MGIASAKDSNQNTHALDAPNGLAHGGPEALPVARPEGGGRGGGGGERGQHLLVCRCVLYTVCLGMCVQIGHSFLIVHIHTCTSCARSTCCRAGEAAAVDCSAVDRTRARARATGPRLLLLLGLLLPWACFSISSKTAKDSGV